MKLFDLAKTDGNKRAHSVSLLDDLLDLTVRNW